MVTIRRVWNAGLLSALKLALAGGSGVSVSQNLWPELAL